MKYGNRKSLKKLISTIFTLLQKCSYNANILNIIYYSKKDGIDNIIIFEKYFLFIFIRIKMRLREQYHMPKNIYLEIWTNLCCIHIIGHTHNENQIFIHI